MSKLNFETVNAKIREMVKEKLGLETDIKEMKDEFLFGTANGFDSTSLLEFILEIEDVFDIIIPDEDLLAENFASISKITDYVIKMREE